MELSQLSYFVAAAKAESLTSAAASLNVSQSALSKSIQKLERELGTELFTRNHKRLTLNAAGLALLLYSEKALASLSEGLNAVENIHNASESRIFTIAGTFPALFSQLAESYFSAAPGRRCSAALCSYEDALKRVISFEYDCALSLDPNIPDNRIHWTTMVKEPIVGIVSRNSRFLSRKLISLSELAKVPLILSDSGYEQYSRFISLCHISGFNPNIIYKSTGLDYVPRFLDNDAGVVILPIGEARSMLDKAPETACEFVIPPPEQCFREIGLIRRAEGNESLQMDEFYAYCSGFFADYNQKNTEFIANIS